MSLSYFNSDNVNDDFMSDTDRMELYRVFAEEIKHVFNLTF